MAPQNAVKYLQVGFNILNNYEVESCRISQGGIEVKCEVTDEAERKDLETYGWNYYQPVWRFVLED